MNRIRRITAAAVVTALLGFMGAGITAVPAVASCSGLFCAGFDPISQACSATSTQSSSDSLVVLQNRYSQGCNANWARVELTQLGYNNGYRFNEWIMTTDSLGDESMCYPGYNSNKGYLVENCTGATVHATGFWHTDMVDGTNRTLAFVDVFDSNNNFIEQLEADQ